MSRTDLAGVFGVVIKVFASEDSILIADQTIRFDFCRIELDLKFDIFGDRDERA